ncbi:MAG: hypothetical protein IJG45_00410 [Oscillospiraceae bacterium]|nr:hypothetical protein [Oscillospiraceae bacterium]
MVNSVIIKYCKSCDPETASKIVLAVEIALAVVILAALLFFAFAGKLGKKKCCVLLVPMLLLFVLHLVFLLPRPIFAAIYSLGQTQRNDRNNAILLAIIASSVIILLLGIAFIIFAKRTKRWKVMARCLIAVIAVLLAMQFCSLLPYTRSVTEYEAELVGTYETEKEESFPFRATYYQYGSGFLRMQSDFLPGEANGWTNEDEQAWLGAQEYDFEHYTYIVIVGKRIDAVTVDPWDGTVVRPYPFTDVRMEWTCAPELTEPYEQALFLYRIPRVALR